MENTKQSKNLLLLCAAECVALVGKLRAFSILAVEDLCDFHTGKVLRQIRIDVRSTAFIFVVFARICGK